MVKLNQITQIKCEDFDDFTAKVRSTRWPNERIFRGQRDASWPLASLWERNLKWRRDGNSELEGEPIMGEHPERNMDEFFGPESRVNRNRFRDSFLDRFRELVVGLPGVSSKGFADDQQAWALGRHHGLVTPLLDWTYSPYVAIFFSCFDYAEFHNPGLKTDLSWGLNFMGTPGKPAEPIAVWELATAPDLIVEDEFAIFRSLTDRAHRQKAQQGLFTFLTHHTKIDLESYLCDRGLAHYLTRYELPGPEVGRALHNITLMNVRYATLFPDIEGVAIDANIRSAFNSLQFQYRLPEEESTDATLSQEEPPQS